MKNRRIPISITRGSGYTTVLCFKEPFIYNKNPALSGLHRCWIYRSDYYRQFLAGRNSIDIRLFNKFSKRL